MFQIPIPAGGGSPGPWTPGQMLFYKTTFGVLDKEVGFRTGCYSSLMSASEAGGSFEHPTSGKTLSYLLHTRFKCAHSVYDLLREGFPLVTMSLVKSVFLFCGLQAL